MPNYRIGRLSEDIKRELSALLRQLKDPRISSMTSILRCEVSGDGSHCKVHVSALEGLEATKETVKGLTSASGFLRREIGNRLHLRKCPELHFIVDDSIAYSAHINEILHKIADERVEENDGQAKEEVVDDDAE
jgi:ribosome-binding factor A